MGKQIYNNIRIENAQLQQANARLTELLSSIVRVYGGEIVIPEAQLKPVQGSLTTKANTVERTLVVSFKPVIDISSNGTTPRS